MPISSSQLHSLCVAYRTATASLGNKLLQLRDQFDRAEATRDPTEAAKLRDMLRFYANSPLYGLDKEEVLVAKVEAYYNASRAKIEANRRYAERRKLFGPASGAAAPKRSTRYDANRTFEEIEKAQNPPEPSKTTLRDDYESPGVALFETLPEPEPLAAPTHDESIEATLRRIVAENPGKYGPLEG